jgi:cell wall-associated NlpC family hydrolase
MRVVPVVSLARSRFAAALALGFALASPAFAAPEDADPLLKLLADQGAAGDAPEPRVERGHTPAQLLRRVHDRTAEMAIAALDFVGVRYRRGGTSAETGFDCSGFTRHVFEMSLGLVLPRRADEQAGAPGLVAVARDDLQPGDLVFFNTLKRTFSHVGIYLGANRFVHAPHSGAQVRTDDISVAYWSNRFTGARRLATTAAVAPKDAVVPMAASVASGS